MGIIIRPIVTEKLDKLNQSGVYGFRVVKSASKEDIKKAVEEAYNVKVSSVNTSIVNGKAKMRSTKRSLIKGFSASYKKAYVTLENGQEIDFYSNI
ncbi:MAG: 50S ribosomal protein L23 [Paludibacteraceae bacterium]|nr:50S ribosomal protein L23 [Candidatus Physcocola equi]MCQ2233967.1 50S ribosomal protein L23 [Paludibacteraceae bacterium]